MTIFQGKSILDANDVGLTRPGAGHLAVLGEAPSPGIARQVGYMPQLGALYRELSMRKIVGPSARNESQVAQAIPVVFIRQGCDNSGRSDAGRLFDPLPLIYAVDGLREIMPQGQGPTPEFASPAAFGVYLLVAPAVTPRRT